MASISETTRIVGVARSTLLYYERIGIVRPARNPENGYREYSPEDIDNLLLVRQLTQAGFTLNESLEVMTGTLDPALLEERYRALGEQIESLITAREVLKSLLVHASGAAPADDHGGEREQSWHAEFERTGAEAHDTWLRRLGFSEKERLYIRWVTRNMTDIEPYMSDFFAIFEHMNRQGPGSRESTLRVLEAISDLDTVETILDIGCGTGAGSLLLAEQTGARITALDNHQPFLDILRTRAAQAGMKERITTVNRSMFELEFPHGSFDMIWSEGSAYFMGFEQALQEWRHLLTSRGYLFVSDAVWLTDTPSPECADYWRIEYPGMSDVDTRTAQALRQGYEIESWFVLPRQDWVAFFNDMESCVRSAASERGMTRTYRDMLAEIDLDRRHGHEYSYLCLLLRKQE